MDGPARFPCTWSCPASSQEVKTRVRAAWICLHIFLYGYFELHSLKEFSVLASFGESFLFLLMRTVIETAHPATVRLSGHMGPWFTQSPEPLGE